MKKGAYIFEGLFRAAAVMALSGTLAGCFNDKGCRVVMAGDSISDELARQAPARDDSLGYQFSIVNAAVRGGGIFHKPVASHLYDKIKEGDHVVISIGANDVLLPAVANAIETRHYKGPLSRFIKQVIERGGKPVLLDYNTVPDNEYFTPAQTHLINNKLNKILHEVAAEYEIPLISTVGAERDDGVHLSAEGARVVIASIWEQGGLSADQACHIK